MLLLWGCVTSHTRVDSRGDLRGAVTLRNHALVAVVSSHLASAVAKRLNVFQLLFSASQSRLEDLDGGLQLARLIVTRPRRLFQQVVFFAHLGELAVQIEDLLVLRFEFLHNCDLLFKGNSSLRI